MAVNFIIIGRRVREIRLQKQISQEILAEWIEMSVTYISHIETAKKRASLETLVKIANALGTTVDQLLSGNQENDQEEYKEELVQLLGDCTGYEKRVIYEIAAAAKRSIRSNKCLQHDGEWL